ncbi:MAG TPA: MerR family transcriptional regulator [Xanthobacteraceae bacterium]|nr:MerR family transcriptional regulator [Xanthobacteraceae bacterium]
MEKAPDAFRTISEVAEELDVPQHVLRFWESRFREIRPMKRGGGRRYYRPDDIDLLRGIRHLLYGEGYTIRGVQRLLREQGVRFVQSVWQPGAPQPTLQPAEAAPDDDDADEGEEGDQPEASDGGPAASRLVAPAGLAREDRQKLQTALHDLTECRRLLGASLAEKD